MTGHTETQEHITKWLTQPLTEQEKTKLKDTIKLLLWDWTHKLETSYTARNQFFLNIRGVLGINSNWSSFVDRYHTKAVPKRRWEHLPKLNSINTKILIDFIEELIAIWVMDNQSLISWVDSQIDITTKSVVQKIQE
jgi:hypothetical protein